MVFLTGVLFLSMKKKYRSTFFTFETGAQCTRRLFIEGDDVMRSEVLAITIRHWRPIEDKVASWIRAGWFRWEDEKPAWFTDIFKDSVPKFMLPKKSSTRKFLFEEGEDPNNNEEKKMATDRTENRSSSSNSSSEEDEGEENVGLVKKKRRGGGSPGRITPQSPSPIISGRNFLEAVLMGSPQLMKRGLGVVGRVGRKIVPLNTSNVEDNDNDEEKEFEEDENMRKESDGSGEEAVKEFDEEEFRREMKRRGSIQI